MTIRSPLYTRVERRAPRVSLRSQLDVTRDIQLTTLAGQDAMGPVTLINSEVRKPFSVALRTWTNNLLETTLAPEPPVGSGPSGRRRIDFGFGFGV